MKHSKIVMLLTLGALALTAPNAHAYLDPGSGSAILQTIIAILISSALALKVFWQRFKAFFLRLFSKPGAIEKDSD